MTEVARIIETLVALIGAWIESGECPLTIPPFMSPPQIAKLFSMKAQTVREWIESGELIASNIGKGQQRPRYLVARADLLLFLERRRVVTRQPKAPTRRTPQPATSSTWRRY